MKHLLAEGDEMIADAEDDATRDAVMIASAQKVEHYEIASYGTLRTWANLLGNSDVAARLTTIAESFVNEAAAEGDEEEEELARAIPIDKWRERCAPRHLLLSSAPS